MRQLPSPLKTRIAPIEKEIDERVATGAPLLEAEKNEFRRRIQVCLKGTEFSFEKGNDGKFGFYFNPPKKSAIHSPNAFESSGGMHGPTLFR